MEVILCNDDLQCVWKVLTGTLETSAAHLRESVSGKTRSQEFSHKPLHGNYRGRGPFYSCRKPHASDTPA